MPFVESVFGVIGDLTWGWSLVPLLVIFGLFITVLTGFSQFRFFKRMFRVLSNSNQSADPNAISAREAGLGSAPNVAATADVRHPVSQGITQSFPVFIDTLFICTCTAFIILLGDVYVPGADGIDGIVLTQQSLVSHLGSWAQYFLSVMILLFAFSSIIYNYYLGENAMTVITKNSMAIQVLQVVLIGIVFLGATAPNATAVFFFADPMMGVLAVVNLVVLMMLLPTCLRILKDFRKQLAAGVARPVLNPDDFADLDLDWTAWTGKVID